MRIEYPRPQFKRADWLLLNGEWDFAFDDFNIGQKEKWYNLDSLPLKINVPFAYESKLSGINDTSCHDFIWYKRKVVVPEKWQGKRIFINFGAVDYYSRIYVNGHFVGDHIGGNTSFSFDITDYLNYKEEDITVFVTDYSRKETQPRGKQFWEDKSRAIWYTRTSGIWQSVFLECVDEFHVKNIKITPDIDKGYAEFEIELSDLSENLYIDLEVKLGDDIVNFIKIKADNRFVKVVVDIFKNKIMNGFTHGMGLCWSPENPVLFDVYVRLSEENNILDTVYSYFGMRKIHVENGKIFLNNHRYYMRLVLDQGYWPDGLLTAPSDKDFIKDIELAKQMGFNGARKHQKVEDPLYLYYADKLGFLVWGEMANSASYDDEYVKLIQNEWIDIIKRDYNHPCIVTWVPMNESWGVPNLKTCKKQQAHLQALYYLTKSLDQTRLVISNDGWEMTDTDICAIHTYDHGTIDDVKKHHDYANILSSRESLISCPSTNRFIFVDGYELGDRPIIITEFGGVAYGFDENAFGYTNVDNEKDFIKFMSIVFNAIHNSKAIEGFCYTQLTDVEQEVNGLLTKDRKPKCDINIIRDIVLNNR